MKTSFPAFVRLARVQLCFCRANWLLFICLTGVCWYSSAQSQPLPGTAPLTAPGDLASNLIAGADRFLLRKINEAEVGRARFWHRNFSSWQAYEQSLATNRQHLAHILGVSDARVSPVDVELEATPTRPALCGRGNGFAAFAVRWPAFGQVHGEGLLLTPVKRAPVANIVAIPDADQTPEQVAGLTAGVAPESQFARRLAESGCQVLIPVLIDRHLDPERNLSNREFIYRPAYELGRHIIGYEIEKVLAAVDWMACQGSNSPVRIGIMGWGEGGLLAFYSAALDTRVAATCVSGYFDDRSQIWQQPIERNVFGLLEQFGDAEVAAMIAPRSLIIEAAHGPEVTMAGGDAYSEAQRRNGAPGRLMSPTLENVRREFERARAMVAALNPLPRVELVVSGDGGGPFGSESALKAFLSALAPYGRLAPEVPAPENLRAGLDPAARQARQLAELDWHTQWLLNESPRLRDKFMAKFDTSSLEELRQSAGWYREFFYHEIIGRFDEPLLPANPRTRKIYDEPNWTGYEVVLDVHPDLICEGVLLLPKGLKAGERRPVVVCQHGLEGRPQDVITGDSHFYHDFARRLCEQGFITFAPQGLFIFHDRFRTLQRKANPLGKTLYSLMVPEHQQLINWLTAQPFVDPERIGFYGLSYGGKSAMRIPALVTNYCLSICSGDFNDWVWKNATTRSRYGYVWTPEYEIVEFDLGETFNYAEMSALIAPRPFMVERGHLDSVAPDETVAYEFAKTRFFYEARLGLQDRCAIEWFTGPHTIHGKGTFEFLHRHLDWPGPGVSARR
ncbi:MAG TPA: dienelactone hydrolase family protein [Verrucomicrobiae bacterium]|nr:dienelactone hydrolase family protein [Verrucomicrobiae bacterium]